MITDSLLGVQPNLTLYSSAQEAIDAASELEKKFRSKIGVSGEEGGGDESDEEEDGPLDNGNHSKQGDEDEEEDDEEDPEVCDTPPFSVM